MILVREPHLILRMDHEYTLSRERTGSLKIIPYGCHEEEYDANDDDRSSSSLVAQ